MISASMCVSELQTKHIHYSCPESIRPFWISRELAAWPWCNLAASQRRPYCASVNSHSPVGLVSWQWYIVDWACVLCDHRIHKSERADQLHQDNTPYPFYSSHAGFCGKASHHPHLSTPLQPRFDFLWFLAFPKAKIAVEREVISECDSTQAQLTTSHCQLTSPMGDWLFMDAQ
jgi:hypothetical protein